MRYSVTSMAGELATEEITADQMAANGEWLDFIKADSSLVARYRAVCVVKVLVLGGQEETTNAPEQ